MANRIGGANMTRLDGGLVRSPIGTARYAYIGTPDDSRPMVATVTVSRLSSTRMTRSLRTSARSSRRCVSCTRLSWVSLRRTARSP